MAFWFLELVEKAMNKQRGLSYGVVSSVRYRGRFA